MLYKYPHDDRVGTVNHGKLASKIPTFPANFPPITMQLAVFVLFSFEACLKLKVRRWRRTRSIAIILGQKHIFIWRILLNQSELFWAFDIKWWIFELFERTENKWSYLFLLLRLRAWSLCYIGFFWFLIHHEVAISKIVS